MGWNQYVTKNSFYCYVSNQNRANAAVTNEEFINTHWHLFPNQSCKHTMTYKQFEHLIGSSSRIKPVSQKISIGHGVPLASIAAVAGQQGEIIAFNNTLPILLYQDNDYFTIHQKNDQNIPAREGEEFDGSTHKAFMLSEFLEPKNSIDNWSFDPFVQADRINILYPGNNGCSFEWHVHDDDKNKYYQISHTANSWYRKQADQTAATWKMDTQITIGKQDPTQSVKHQVRWLSGGLESTDNIYRHPIPNLLIKLQPIIAPSTQKRIVHYCKLFCTIETVWEYLPFTTNYPVDRIPKRIIREAKKWVTTIPVQLGITEEDLPGATFKWTGPDGSTEIGDLTLINQPAKKQKIDYSELSINWRHKLPGNQLETSNYKIVSTDKERDHITE